MSRADYVRVDRSHKKDRGIPNKSSVQAVTAFDINFVRKIKEKYNKYKTREYWDHFFLFVHRET